MICIILKIDALFIIKINLFLNPTISYFVCIPTEGDHMIFFRQNETKTKSSSFLL